MSEYEREKGNEYFLKGTIDFAPSLQKSRLCQALMHYENAFNYARTNDDRAKAAKNKAVTLAKLSFECLPRFSEFEENGLETGDYFKIFETFRSAAHFGFESNNEINNPKRISNGWLEDIAERMDKCWKQAIEHVKNFTSDDLEEEQIQSIKLLDSFSLAIVSLKSAVFMKVIYEINLKLAVILFQQAVSLLGDGAYHSCLNLITQSQRPLRQALAASSNEVEKAEIVEQQRLVFVHSCICESWQARQIGNEMVEELLFLNEFLDTDLLWTAVDKFREAIILTREVDIEGEAISLSRLGFVFEKIHPDHQKAMTYYSRCIQLAHCLFPSKFLTKEWFIQARDSLITLQLEKQKKEQEEEERLDEEQRKEMKPIFDQLEVEAKRSAQAFLRFIYKNHPPVRCESPQNVDTISPEDTGKVVRKAIGDYHPDKHQNHERKIFVLYSKITSHLTTIYQQVK